MYTIEFVSNFSIILITLLMFLFLYYRYPSKVLDFSFALIISISISEGIKYFVDIPRPINIYNVEGSSFPSTHTSIVSCIFFFYLLVCRGILKKPGREAEQTKKISNHLFLSIIIVLGIIVISTRIVMNVHYMTDILGGILIGCISVVPFIYYDVSGGRTK